MLTGADAGATAPWERVQMDSTPCDIRLVREHDRTVIGRPNVVNTDGGNLDQAVAAAKAADAVIVLAGRDNGRLETRRAKMGRHRRRLHGVCWNFIGRSPAPQKHHRACSRNVVRFRRPVRIMAGAISDGRERSWCNCSSSRRLRDFLERRGSGRVSTFRYGAARFHASAPE